jgi:hypothetical protein
MIIARTCFCLSFLIGICFQITNILNEQKCRLTAIHQGFKSSLYINQNNKTLSLQQVCNDGLISRKALIGNEINTYFNNEKIMQLSLKK